MSIFRKTAAKVLAQELGKHLCDEAQSAGGAPVFAADFSAVLLHIERYLSEGAPSPKRPKRCIKVNHHQFAFNMTKQFVDMTNREIN